MARQFVEGLRAGYAIGNDWRDRSNQETQNKILGEELSKVGTQQFGQEDYARATGLQNSYGQARQLAEQDATFGGEGAALTADSLNYNEADPTKADPNTARGLQTKSYGRRDALNSAYGRMAESGLLSAEKYSKLQGDLTQDRLSEMKVDEGERQNKVSKYLEDVMGLARDSNLSDMDMASRLSKLASGHDASGHSFGWVEMPDGKIGVTTIDPETRKATVRPMTRDQMISEALSYADPANFFKQRERVAKDEDTRVDNRRADRQLDVLEKHYGRQDSAAAIRASNSGGGAGGGRGGNSDAKDVNEVGEALRARLTSAQNEVGTLTGKLATIDSSTPFGLAEAGRLRDQLHAATKRRDDADAGLSEFGRGLQSRTNVPGSKRTVDVPTGKYSEKDIGGIAKRYNVPPEVVRKKLKEEGLL